MNPTGACAAGERRKPGTPQRNLRGRDTAPASGRSLRREALEVEAPKGCRRKSVTKDHPDLARWSLFVCNCKQQKPTRSGVAGSCPVGRPPPVVGAAILGCDAHYPVQIRTVRVDCILAEGLYAATLKAWSAVVKARHHSPRPRARWWPSPPPP